jgi:hypothetical protein
MGASSLGIFVLVLHLSTCQDDANIFTRHAKAHHAREFAAYQKLEKKSFAG